jgi:Ca2+/H+ antiporter, TMEM165/GDT1 family
MNRIRKFDYKKRDKRHRFIPAVAIIGIALFGWIVMLLWNELLPELFGFAQIGYWQAVGLLILSKILFGGLHFGHKGHRHHDKYREAQDIDFRDRFLNLTPEEKEKFKREWCERFDRCEGKNTPKD